MGKPKVLTQDEREYLRLAVEQSHSYVSMALHMSVCVDTLKRILQREGLAEFEGAKYVVSLSRTNKPETWRRPCMSCKDDKPRPKWQYLCAKCRNGEAETEYSLWL
jgi:hypothetical protein